MKWFHILLKKDYIRIWKAIDHNTRKFIGWQCGDRSSKTLTEFFDRLDLWRAKRAYSDFYVCYADGVGSQRLQQGKQNTFKIEQNNALKRHWLGRFRRRTKIVTRSLDILNKSLTLFQRFRINGNIEEVLSLLK
ncbi:IS1 family transposase [Desulfovibrio sp. SGI.169]|uniref:IS1 family transposase n=1 Tax=Desulfovibrio sp. SGI.169 TaxID=3420561 RepID=UPI003D020F18